MEILLVNHKQTQCGVYQYGKRLSDILKKIKGHRLTYVECDSAMELLKHIETIKPNLILYNWHELTMKWVNPNFTKNLGNIKQIFIYHEAGFNTQMKHDALIYINFFEDETKKYLHYLDLSLRMNLLKKIMTFLQSVVLVLGFITKDLNEFVI